MRASTNAVQGSQNFAVEVHRQADGRYAATAPWIPAVPPQVGATEREAILAIRQVLERYTVEGIYHE